MKKLRDVEMIGGKESYVEESRVMWNMGRKSGKSVTNKIMNWIMIDEWNCGLILRYSALFNVSKH